MVNEPWLRGEKVRAHYEWPAAHLPRSVHSKILVMAPHEDRAKRCKRKIAITLVGLSEPVLIKRKGFRCDETLALLCLVAPP